MSDYDKCLAILADCERDAKANDGKPFNGRTFGEATGNILAMIAALADIQARMIQESWSRNS